MNNHWKVASLVSKFEESATLALGAKAKKLAQAGQSIVNFGVGEPDFNTPAGIIDRAFDSARKGATKYTAVSGIPSLRAAIAKKIGGDYGVSFEADQVLVSCGGKQAIYHFLQATLEPGDEVIILSPYWVSFPEMVKLVGAKPVIVRASRDRISAADIHKAITPKTKLFILNSPSNPSGTVFSKEEVKSFLAAIKPHPIWLMSDDTYYQLVYEPTKWVSALAIDPDFKERTCVIGSSSKTYAMTGWRLGWAMGPKHLIDAMTKLQSQVTSSACTISQVATEAALQDFQSEAEGFRKEFEKRKNLMLSEIEKIPGLSALKPEGAFYIFVDFSKALKGKAVETYAEELLEKFGVCIIPGVAFGEPNFGRLSYALSDADIREGMRLIKKA